MPIAVNASEQPRNGLTKFTNCRLLRGNKLVKGDLWVSSETGKIVDSQACFFDDLVLPQNTVDLGGRIVSPGMIECQLNGAFGFNFSTLLDDMSQYGKKLKEVNKLMVQTGVTSYVPTITSQRPELYQAVSTSKTTVLTISTADNSLFRLFRSLALPASLTMLKTVPSRSVLTAKDRFSTLPKTACTTSTC